jgi:hypothetical protein
MLYHSGATGSDITCPRCTLDPLSVYHSGAAGIDIRGAIASLSMLSYTGKCVFPHLQDEWPAVPLPREQLSQAQADSEPEEIPDW